MTKPQVAPSEARDVARGDARRCREALALDAMRAAQGLRLDAETLAVMFETDELTGAAIRAGHGRFPPESDLARRLLLLVRLHRGLGDVYGSMDRVDRWLESEEPALGAPPRELMRTPSGLARVVATIEGRCKDCLW